MITDPGSCIWVLVPGFSILDSWYWVLNRGSGHRFWVADLGSWFLIYLVIIEILEKIHTPLKIETSSEIFLSLWKKLKLSVSNWAFKTFSSSFASSITDTSRIWGSGSFMVPNLFLTEIYSAGLHLHFSRNVSSFISVLKRN